MSYLLFLIAIGLAIALALIFRRFKQLQQNNRVTQQQLAEAQKRLKAIDRKYSGLISKQEAAQKLQLQIAKLQKQHQQIIEKSHSEEQKLTEKIRGLNAEIHDLEESSFLQDFGFYESKYDFGEASEYKEKLDEIRAKQKEMLKYKTAAVCHTEWTVEGSRKKGEKMTNDFLKLILRAFNGECDAAVARVKYNNVQTMKNRIKKSCDTINNLAKSNRAEITQEYLGLKLQELFLTHEFQEKKQQEQEEQRQIREQMREEERASRELEKVRQDAEKEEQRQRDALEKARREVEKTTGEAQQKLLSQIEELQRRVAEAEVNKQRAISQAQLTKSGHVYVISNIGSFGENVYKIGMTRRIDPMDRVKELGDASVPFPFDVHAMIYCENAPELENRLHKQFDDRRLNKINNRKEFFRVSLDEIGNAVREIDEELQTTKSEFILTKIAEAAEYRRTLAMERSKHQVPTAPLPAQTSQEM